MSSGKCRFAIRKVDTIQQHWQRHLEQEQASYREQLHDDLLFQLQKNQADFHGQQDQQLQRSHLFKSHYPKLQVNIGFHSPKPS